MNKLGQQPSLVFLSSGQVTLRGVPMNLLIQLACKEVYPAEYIKGGPAWLGSDYFDVVAKAPAGTPVDTARLMLQKLLVNLFHLTVHREQKTMPVFTMTVAKRGAKLTDAAGKGDAKLRSQHHSGQCVPSRLPQYDDGATS